MKHRLDRVLAWLARSWERDQAFWFPLLGGMGALIGSALSDQAGSILLAGLVLLTATWLGPLALAYRCLRRRDIDGFRRWSRRHTWILMGASRQSTRDLYEAVALLLSGQEARALELFRTLEGSSSPITGWNARYFRLWTLGLLDRWENVVADPDPAPALVHVLLYRSRLLMARGLARIGRPGDALAVASLVLDQIEGTGLSLLRSQVRAMLRPVLVESAVALADPEGVDLALGGPPRRLGGRAAAADSACWRARSLARGGATEEARALWREALRLSGGPPPLDWGWDAREPAPGPALAPDAAVLAGRQALRTLHARIEGLRAAGTMFGFAPVTWGLGTALVATALWMHWRWGPASEPPMIQGAFSPFIPIEVEPLRLLTYAYLHKGWAHLFVNLLTLLAIGPALERALGAAGMGCVLAASAVTGAALSGQFRTKLWVVGASGCVLGVAGAMGAVALVDLRAGRRRNLSFLPVAIISAVGDVLLAGQGVDVAVHAGGLVAGALIGALLASRWQPRVVGAMARVGALAALGLGVLAAWRMVTYPLDPSQPAYQVAFTQRVHPGLGYALWAPSLSSTRYDPAGEELQSAWEFDRLEIRALTGGDPDAILTAMRMSRRAHRSRAARADPPVRDRVVLDGIPCERELDLVRYPHVITFDEVWIRQVDGLLLLLDFSGLDEQLAAGSWTRREIVRTLSLPTSRGPP